MKKRILKVAPDRPEDLFHNVMSDGEVELGIHRVMYGFRIRAGYVGEPYVEWDWCCGDNHILLMMTYGAAKILLENGVAFKEMPGHSRIKPWNKDENFIHKLTDKVKEFEPELKFLELLKSMDLYQPLKIEEDENR